MDGLPADEGEEVNHCSIAHTVCRGAFCSPHDAVWAQMDTAVVAQLDSLWAKRTKRRGTLQEDLVTTRQVNVGGDALLLFAGLHIMRL